MLSNKMQCGEQSCQDPSLIVVPLLQMAREKIWSFCIGRGSKHGYTELNWNVNIEIALWDSARAAAHLIQPSPITL